MTRCGAGRSQIDTPAIARVACAPIVRAFEQGAEFADPWQDAATVASGLRVPVAVGDFLMLRALRESGGTAVAVTDEDLLEGVRLLGEQEGLFVCPEGGALVAALRHLAVSGWIRRDEQVVLFNTGAGLKYPECFRDLELPVLDPDEPGVVERL